MKLFSFIMCFVIKKTKLFSFGVAVWFDGWASATTTNKARKEYKCLLQRK